MEVVKRFTAMKLNTQTKSGGEVRVNFSYGRDGYCETQINESFETEEEAINAAFKNDKYADWVIVPVIHFIN